MTTTAGVFIPAQRTSEPPTPGHPHQTGRVRLPSAPLSPIPARSCAAAAAAIEAVLAFLAQDGRAERLLAGPRPGCCRGQIRPCDRCAHVEALARQVASTPATRAHRIHAEAS